MFPYAAPSLSVIVRMVVNWTWQVVFDTGSSTLEFASTLCASCSNPVLFDPDRSSTFRDGGRVSSITFATGVGVDPVVGANYRLTLRSAVDTVSVSGLTAPNTNLFLITDQTPTFNIDPFSGIQGLPPYQRTSSNDPDYHFPIPRHECSCPRILLEPRGPRFTMCEDP